MSSNEEVEVIQLIRLSDIAKIMPLIDKFFEKVQTAYTQKQFLQFLTATLFSPAVRVWVAFKGNEPIGYEVVVLSNTFYGNEMLLLQVYIKPKHKAKELLDEAEKWAKLMGCDLKAVMRREMDKAMEKYGFKYELTIYRKTVS